ncbi:hypothetical protein P12x_002831 [Tundrisphaera lichenicola]|uniref:hypothetical protein n=1 Tax=Tundrisphaera lichenicola TaxID=2029860 RepID=UPI003EBEC213
MSITLDEIRPRKIRAKSPTLREVCLVGTPSRRYRHIAPEGARPPGPDRKSTGPSERCAILHRGS